MTIARAAIGVFAAAFFARFVAALAAPGMHHPDEIFQSLEQAHRLVFGYGFVPWEYEYGVRSWLLPGFLAAIMQASRLFGDGPHLYLPMIAAVLSAIGAGAITCIFLWAYRLFGLWPALVGVAIPAFAPELVYFSPRALTEVVAGHVLVIGLYLAFPGDPVVSRGRLAAAGGLFALAVAVRLQMAPAIALVAAYGLWRLSFRDALWVAFGGLAVIGVAGLTDWLSWGTAFLSYWNNFRFNIGYDVAAHFGVDPWHFYIARLAVMWGPALALHVPLALLGARFKPLLAVLALVVLAAHQPIGHKELRFLYPLMLLVEALAALGLAAVVNWLMTRVPASILPWEPARARLMTAAGIGILALFVIGRQVNFILIPDQGLAWSSNRPMVQAALDVSRRPNVCGIAALDIPWFLSGGYAHLHQPVPFYTVRSAAELREKLPAFNTVIFRNGEERAVGLGEGRCYGNHCVVQRPGGCEPMPITPLDLPPQLQGVPRLRQLWPPASFPAR